MTKNRAILLLGVLVAATPFIGFPFTWEETITTISGLIIAVLAFLLARDRRLILTGQRHYSTPEPTVAIPLSELEPDLVEEVLDELETGVGVR